MGRHFDKEGDCEIWGGGKPGELTKVIKVAKAR